jgi:hypothetical protein
MSTTFVTIELPANAFKKLQETAHQQHRSINEVARDLILRELPDLPPLPPELQTELAAFANLSNEVLWVLARSTLTEPQQQELAKLNDEAQRRLLTEVEQNRQQILIDIYNRVLVHRAHAAALLRARGYDLADPTILTSPQ